VCVERCSNIGLNKGPSPDYQRAVSPAPSPASVTSATNQSMYLDTQASADSRTKTLSAMAVATQTDIETDSQRVRRTRWKTDVHILHYSLGRTHQVMRKARAAKAKAIMIKRMTCWKTCIVLPDITHWIVIVASPREPHVLACFMNTFENVASFGPPQWCGPPKLSVAERRTAWHSKLLYCSLQRPGAVSCSWLSIAFRATALSHMLTVESLAYLPD
jgi:hypothetical protein